MNMPVAETVTLASVGKWLIGIVLLPWMIYERKRVDSLFAEMYRNHYSKEETKEQIHLRNKPLVDKLDMIHRDVIALRNRGDNSRHDN